VLDAMVAAAFQHVQEADDVAVYIGMRVFDGVTHAGLGAQVDHAVEGAFGKQGGHGRAVGQVQFFETEGAGPSSFDPRQARLFERHVVIVVEVVEAHDIVAATEQRAANLCADKPRGAGDQDSHGQIVPPESA